MFLDSEDCKYYVIFYYLLYFIQNNGEVEGIWGRQMPKHAAGKAQVWYDVMEILKKLKQRVMTGEGNN